VRSRNSGGQIYFPKTSLGKFNGTLQSIKEDDHETVNYDDGDESRRESKIMVVQPISES
jgi:hypothetical protein